MKIGLNKIDRSSELKWLAEQQCHEVYTPQSSNEQVLVKYTDTETNQEKSVLYSVGGNKDETVKYALNYTLIHEISVRKVFKDHLSLPFTPLEWLEKYELYKVEASNNYNIKDEYCLVPKDNTDRKMYYFTPTSPLVLVSKLCGYGYELRERVEGSVEKSEAMTHEDAVVELTKIGAIHDRTINKCRAGDVIFTSNSKFRKVGKKELGQDSGGFSHAAIFAEHGLVREATMQVTHSLPQRIKIRLAKRLMQAITRLGNITKCQPLAEWLWKKVYVNDDEIIDCKNVREVAASWVLDTAKHGWTIVRPLPELVVDPDTDLSPTLYDTGKPYGAAKGLGKAGANTALKKNRFKGSDAPEYFICTQYVNYVLRAYANSKPSSPKLNVSEIEVRNHALFDKELDWQAPNAMYLRFVKAGVQTIN